MSLERTFFWKKLAILASVVSRHTVNFDAMGGMRAICRRFVKVPAKIAALSSVSQKL